MKRIILILSCVCLLFFAACQSGDENGPTEMQTSEESSLSSSSETLPEKEPPSSSPTTDESAAAETESAESGKLSVPVQIVMENENPEVYEIPIPEGVGRAYVAGTEEDLKVYMAWIDALDGADVTAIYGHKAPVREYTPGEMSLSDSQILFDKLKAIKPGLLSEEDLDNVWVGGGMSISIQTKEDRAVISFNGGWFLVYLDNQEREWVFNAQEKSVQSACYEIMRMLEDNMNNGGAEQTPLCYKDQEVTSIYAVDTDSYVMAKISGYALSKEILSELETDPPSGSNLEGLGYLIFTETGKEYVYLDSTNPALTETCLTAIINGPLYPSWLIHMSPDRIVSANGVTDKETLLALSEFLKEEVTVHPNTLNHEGPDNPNTVGGLYTLKLVFDSGVSYDLIGYDYFDGTGDFTLYTSDLDRTVWYELDHGGSACLRKYLESLQ